MTARLLRVGRLLFMGTVLPECAAVGSSGLVQIEARYPGIDKPVIAAISIVSSKVSCLVKDDAGIDLSTLKNSVDGYVSFIVDAIGFARGCGYTAVVESVTDLETGELFVFGADVTALGRVAEDSAVSEDKLIDIAGSSAELQRALADLRQAVLEPGDTAFHCYRAIESLRHHWAEGPTGSQSEGRQWALMAKALRSDVSVTKLIKTWSKSQRHGKPVAMTGDERERILILAWQVVHRYSLLLAGDKTQLPPELGVLTA